MKKAVIVGATSGIGREVAKRLAQNGYVVGLTGRRFDLLLDLQKEIQAKTFVKRMDVSLTTEAIKLLEELIAEMGGINLIVISSGVIYWNPDLDWDKDLETIKVNVLGFTAIANAAFRYFCHQRSGHIVGISSISALRGSDKSPSYPASKAFVSNYLEGLRKKKTKLRLPITITDIQPGYVDTPMTRGSRSFWMTSVEEAGKQIFDTIKRKKNQAYITKRWRIVAWVMKLMPSWLHCRI